MQRPPRRALCRHRTLCSRTDHGPAHTLQGMAVCSFWEKLEPYVLPDASSRSLASKQDKERVARGLPVRLKSCRCQVVWPASGGRGRFRAAGLRVPASQRSREDPELTLQGSSRRLLLATVWSLLSKLGHTDLLTHDREQAWIHPSRSHSTTATETHPKMVLGPPQR